MTAASLSASFVREVSAVARASRRAVLLSIVPGLFALLVLADGLVMRNEMPWSDEPRAWTMLGVFVFGIVCLAWHGVRLALPAAIVIGVGGALTVSQAFYSPSRPDVVLWVVLAATFILQRQIKRNWGADLARAGWVVAVVALVMCVGSTLGVPTPNGAWNRNVMAGVLAALLPAAITHAGGANKVTRLIGLVAMAVALLALGSRGGILGAMVALIVSGGHANNLMQRPARAIAIGSIILVLAGLLVLIRPDTAMERLFYWRAANEQWRASSMAWGVGPGNLWLTHPGVGPIDQAHNVIVTLAATTGLAGAVVIGLTLANAKLQLPRWQNWHWATLAALAAHAMVDDPFTWLPTVIIAGLVGASYAE
jgi:hypothetical protein